MHGAQLSCDCGSEKQSGAARPWLAGIQCFTAGQYVHVGPAKRHPAP